MRIIAENNCTVGWKQIGDNCYKAPNVSASSYSVTLDEAEQLCLAEGGNVPSFHSLNEWTDFNMMRYSMYMLHSEHTSSRNGKIGSILSETLS